jgi:hypothetical protein
MPYTEQELNDLRTKVLANKSARERGEPPPYDITPQMLHEAIASLPNTRKVALETKESKAAGKAKAGAAAVDDGLDF